MFGKELLQPGLEHSKIFPEENSNVELKVISGGPASQAKAIIDFRNQANFPGGQTLNFAMWLV